MTDKIISILKAVLGENPSGIFCYDSLVEYHNDSDGFFTKVNYKEGYLCSPIEEVEGIKIAHGITRLVIIPSDTDYVIKLPIMATFGYKYSLSREINGIKESKSIIYDEYFDYDSEYLEDYMDDGWTCEDKYLCEYRHLASDVDIMDQENALIENATSKLKELLLPNKLEGTYNNIPVYTQKKCAHIASNMIGIRNDLTMEQINEVEKIRKDCYVSLNIFFLHKCIKLFGFIETLNLVKEIRELNINDDLHAGNYGFLENETPCIVDFGGYDDSMWVWN